MNTKFRFISIKRKQKVIQDDGKELIQPVRLQVRINNEIPYSHFICEGNRRG